MSYRIPERQSVIGRHFLQLSVLVLLVACLLTPSISVSADMKLPLEVFLLPLILYLYFLLVCIRKARPPRACFVHICGALLSLSILVSIFYGSTYLHHALLIRDYYDSVKVWLPVLFFTIAYQADFDEQATRRFLAVFSVATLLICLYGWAQFLDARVADKLNFYYLGGEHHDIDLQLERRVYSTFGNPNVLGQFLSCALICYVLVYVSRFGSRIKSAAITLAIITGLVLTGSRYALIVSLGSMLLVLLLTLDEPKRTVRLASSTLLLVSLAFAFVMTQKVDRDATNRFQELSNPAEIQSLRGRTDVLWMDALAYFEISPVLGHGPAKVVFTEVTDSEYLDVLKSYGILGFSFYFAMHLWVLIQLWRGLRVNRLSGGRIDELFRADLLLVRLGFVLILAGLAMNIGMATYFNWKLGSFFWLVLGLTVRAAHRMEHCRCRFPLRIFGATGSSDFHTHPGWVQ
jgi:O-antigen ligase